MRITPKRWLVTANARRPKLPNTTDWYPGTARPARVGWYERHFTDSPLIGDATMQYWDGEFWRRSPTGAAHWRQVGDYPAWRGLKHPSALHDNEFALAA